MFQARIFVELKSSILDPAGQAVQNALLEHQLTGISDLRIGKYIVMKIEAASREAAARSVEECCHKLLVNPVIESYSFEINEV